MEDMLQAMIRELEDSNAGFMSVKIGKYTIIITNDDEGAACLSDAWDKYADIGEKSND